MRLHKKLVILLVLMVSTTVTLANTIQIKTPQNVIDEIPITIESKHSNIKSLDLYLMDDNVEKFIKTQDNIDSSVYKDSISVGGIENKNASIIAKNVIFEDVKHSNKPIPTIEIKDTYSINEKIEYNYSYVDIDDCLITEIEWENNQESFDTAGAQIIRLRIKDDCGVWSDWVEKKIYIEGDIGDIAKILVDGNRHTSLSIAIKSNFPELTPSEVNKMAETKNTIYSGSPYEFELNSSAWGKDLWVSYSGRMYIGLVDRNGHVGNGKTFISNGTSISYIPIVSGTEKVVVEGTGQIYLNDVSFDKEMLSK